MASIEDPQKAKTFLKTLGQLEGVDASPAGTPPEKVVTVFFDPRCPYCHAAFAALRDKVATRWIPVVVLGDAGSGNLMAGAILAAPDRAAALAATFDKTKPAPALQPAGSSAATDVQAKIDQNMSAFASIFRASPAMRPGVPTIFVPRPDGRVAIMIGFQAGDEATIQSLLTGS